MPPATRTHGREHLAGELPAHREARAEHVVEEADHEHDRRPEEEGQQLRLDPVGLLQQRDRGRAGASATQGTRERIGTPK